MPKVPSPLERPRSSTPLKSRQMLPIANIQIMESEQKVNVNCLFIPTETLQYKANKKVIPYAGVSDALSID